MRHTDPPIAGPMATIVITDDHPLFRDALGQAVAARLPGARVAETASLDELTALLGREPDVDLVLLDLALPGVRGFSGLIFLRAQHPAVPVAIISATDDPMAISRAMSFGAVGYLPKALDADRIGEAIDAILAGETWTPPEIDLSSGDDEETADLARRLASLTPQQGRVLTMLGDGLLNKQIAYELGVSEATVKAHVSAILQKLGVESRTQAVIASSRIGVPFKAAVGGD